MTRNQWINKSQFSKPKLAIETNQIYDEIYKFENLTFDFGLKNEPEIKHQFIFLTEIDFENFKLNLENCNPFVKQSEFMNLEAFYLTLRELKKQKSTSLKKIKNKNQKIQIKINSKKILSILKKIPESLQKNNIVNCLAAVSVCKLKS